jgi:hypothetical protein
MMGNITSTGDSLWIPSGDMCWSPAAGACAKDESAPGTGSGGGLRPPMRDRRGSGEFACRGASADPARGATRQLESAGRSGGIRRCARTPPSTGNLRWVYETTSRRMESTSLTRSSACLRYLAGGRRHPSRVIDELMATPAATTTASVAAEGRTTGRRLQRCWLG